VQFELQPELPLFSLAMLLTQQGQYLFPFRDAQSISISKLRRLAITNNLFLKAGSLRS
jgi:hypothetical protein